MTHDRLDLLIVADSVQGGLGAAACSHAQWFAQRGWKVVLVAPGVNSVPIPAIIETVEILVPGGASDTRNMLRAARQLRRVMSERAPDLIHAHGTRSELLVLMAGRRPVVTLHGAGRVPGQSGIGTLVRRTARTLAPLPARKAYSAAPAGGRWQTLLMASPRLRRFDVQSIDAMARIPTFLWLGRLDRPKQPEIFVRAVALAARHQEVRGVVLGDGPLLHAMRRLAEAESAPIEFMGERQDVEPFLASAWAVCLFSAFEGIPFAVQEAMWAGRSTLLSPLPSLCWFAADSALFATNVQQAAEAMGELSRGDLAQHRGLAAATRIRQLISADAPFAHLLEDYGTLRR
jgi:glycosyltransferase involved in cell wall biosynthesis